MATGERFWLRWRDTDEWYRRGDYPESQGPWGARSERHTFTDRDEAVATARLGTHGPDGWKNLIALVVPAGQKRRRAPAVPPHANAIPHARLVEALKSRGEYVSPAVEHQREDVRRARGQRKAATMADSDTTRGAVMTAEDAHAVYGAAFDAAWRDEDNAAIVAERAAANAVAVEAERLARIDERRRIVEWLRERARRLCHLEIHDESETPEALDSIAYRIESGEAAGGGEERGESMQDDASHEAVRAVFLAAVGGAPCPTCHADSHGARGVCPEVVGCGGPAEACGLPGCDECATPAGGPRRG